MTQLLLPHDMTVRLCDALQRAKLREIGGVLMGEHVGDDTFQVVELTIQSHSSMFASFVRVVQDFLEPLSQFFQRTNHNYSRFNYLGEWHSHPAFTLTPSATDRATMHDIVNDPKTGALFAVLLIVRLSNDGHVEGHLSVYQPGGKETTGDLIWETT